jgi:soluble lytic murein transglycosylase-like protein
LATIFVVSFSLLAAPSMTTVPAAGVLPSSVEISAVEELMLWWSASSQQQEIAAAKRKIAADEFAADNAKRTFHVYGAASPAAGGAGTPFGLEIRQAAHRHRLDAGLLTAIVATESSFDPAVVSPRGAIGLMQIMPELAGESALDPFEPKANLEIGARYFSRLLNRFDGDVSLALAAYNAGPGAVEKFGGMPPYRETSRFVERVLRLYEAQRGAPVGAEPGRAEVL